MRFFGPSSTEERLAAAARALKPYGFVIDHRTAEGLRRLEPLVELSRPESYTTGVRGTIDGTAVEAYEYSHFSRDGEGGGTFHETLVVALHHPRIQGGASFVPDGKEWGGAEAFLDELFWIPPFTILKGILYLMDARNPDRTVGDADFDRLYRVHAASDEAARRAVTARLRQVCLRLAFRGAVELRAGVLLYSPYSLRLDEKTAVNAFGVGAAFLGAFTATST